MTSVEQFQDGGSLEACTMEEQRSVIHFLGSEWMNPSEIHHRMKMQCGDTCLSLQQVYDWDRKFKSGVSSVADAARSGRPHTADTPEMVAAVECLLRENHHIMLYEVVSELNMNHGSAHHIIHNMLGFRKVSAKWVPRQLTPELKELHF